jgi:hypothetical protein
MRCLRIWIENEVPYDNKENMKSRFPKGSVAELAEQEISFADIKGSIPAGSCTSNIRK